MIRTGAGAALLLLLAGCQANPRNEIAAVADAALAEVKRTAPAQALCVDRVIPPWQPAAQARRHDPPAPPGDELLYAPGVFRGGGGLKGASVGGVRVGVGTGCLTLRGPLIAGDRAMVEVDQAGTALNLWLRRADGDWRVTMTTTGVYGR